ncbi:MAG: glutamine amidotransferase [Deltaproteobacteria bacterium]|nr:glutamine amidotransferase [Deltaproteobacteria bacterium]
MDPILIVKTGTTLASLASECGDFEDWIRAGMDLDPSRVTVVSVFEGANLPNPKRFAGVVVTGSGAMVSHRESWSEQTAAWLRDAVERTTPVLGICYGHQLLAHALGGRVGPNPHGREIGTVRVQLTPEAADDALLAGFGGALLVHTTHSEAVLELPKPAVRLASSKADPNSAFSFGTAAWGVQFHPEFDTHVMKRYIEERRELLVAEDIDADARLSEIEESPDGKAVLRRFRKLLNG